MQGPALPLPAYPSYPASSSTLKIGSKSMQLSPGTVNAPRRHTPPGSSDSLSLLFPPRRTDIFFMHVFDPIYIFLHHLRGSARGVVKCPVSNNRLYIPVCIFHHALYFIWVLHYSSHVVMEGQVDPVLFFAILPSLFIPVYRRSPTPHRSSHICDQR